MNKGRSIIVIKRAAQSGFSLMELFFVLAIVAIMLVASIMYFSSMSRSQDITDVMQEVQAIIQAGGAYVNVYGTYKGFNVENVKKTGLITPKYNLTFKTDDGSEVVFVPWTEEVDGKAGVGIVNLTSADVPSSYNPDWKAFIPDQYFMLRFTDVPAWACNALMQRMVLLATPTDKSVCNSGTDTNITTEIKKLDFILPKLP